MTALDRLLPIAEAACPLRRRLTNVAIGAIPLAVGSLSGVLTSDGIRVWYRTLERPSWNPPDWVFGPVWTTLYILMGVALVQVTRAERPVRTRQIAVGLFALQLVLNFGWSFIFFVNHDRSGALVEIVALLLAIVGTVLAFARIRTSSAVLLLPYLAWTSFATVLTARIWQLNR